MKYGDNYFKEEMGETAMAKTSKKVEKTATDDKASLREAEKDFVRDNYFEKGHLFTKIYITVAVIIGWIAVVIPIYWTLSSTIFRNVMKPVWDYEEGRRMVSQLNLFFAIAFVVLLIGAIGFTLYNNYKIKNRCSKEIVYDTEQLRTRMHVYDDLMTERFGNSQIRENTRYYVVPAEKNLATDELKKAYKKAGVGQ